MMIETPTIESSVLLSTTGNMKNSSVEHQPNTNNQWLDFSRNKNPMLCIYIKKVVAH